LIKEKKEKPECKSLLKGGDASNQSDFIKRPKINYFGEFNFFVYKETDLN
jgi:hypothetical protein